MFLNKEEIEEGCKNLSSVIELLVDTENGDLLADHMNDLSTLQPTANLLTASSKRLYLLNKKNADANSLYVYCEGLEKSLHYKLSSLQSILRKTVQEQFINNKHI